MLIGTKVQTSDTCSLQTDRLCHVSYSNIYCSLNDRNDCTDTNKSLSETFFIKIQKSFDKIKTPKNVTLEWYLLFCSIKRLYIIKC